MSEIEPAKQPLTWLPPVAMTDERLACAFCSWSCPRWYQNQTGPKAPPPGRDGNIRLTEHARAEHLDAIRKQKAASKSKRRYAEKKALRAALTDQQTPEGSEA